MMQHRHHPVVTNEHRPRGRRRHAQTRGFVVPVVVAALCFFGLYAGFLMYASRGELNLLSKTIKQDRARIIAESAIELGRALIFQNGFDDRWYKQTEFDNTRVGFKGSLTGKIGGGEFLLVAEDIANDAKGLDVGVMVQKLTYNRIDLFAEGRYGDTRVIVVKSLFWHPEQKCFAYDTETIEQPDGTTKTVFTNIHTR